MQNNYKNKTANSNKVTKKSKNKSRAFKRTFSTAAIANNANKKKNASKTASSFSMVQKLGLLRALPGK